MKDTLDPRRIAGSWINVYDRNYLNLDYQCYAVKLEHSIFPFAPSEEEVGQDEKRLVFDFS